MTSSDWLVVAGVAAFLLLILMLLGYLLIRDVPVPRIRRTRVGVFVERDRLPELDEQWPDPEQTRELPKR